MNLRNPARLSLRKQNKKVVESDESSISDSDSDDQDSSELVLSDSDESQFRKKVNKIAMKSSSSRMGIVKALGASDVQGYYRVLQSVDDELKDLSDQVRKLQSEVLAEKPKRSPSKPNLPESNYLTQQPKSLVGGQLKDYQLAGLNWMISLYEKYLNGILADQMGLGKTIQTIGFIAYLADKYNIRGPHVIIAPLTTVRNWMREFSKWMPNCKVMILEALQEKREEQIKIFYKEKMEVILTSYESVRYNHDFFVGLRINLLLVDEAHRMKNEQAQFSQLMRFLKARFKLLLTGTPIHNNTQELWALLNFIMPQIFHNATLFTDWTDINNQMSKNSIFEPALQKMNIDMITRLRNIISPFMLRRTKDEVEKQIPAKKEIHIYVQLTPLQKEQYRQILFQLNPNKYYQNKLMHLRKLCVHPYCFPDLDTEEIEVDEHIVNNCGKMRFLDKLLERLIIRQKHKVLIFSQFKMMLDILEDYLALRKYQYRRIDGDTPVDDRELFIQEFQAPNSKLQIFILSTRAGGLGITLTAADQVVIYDSDFNPQMDLQAMDRAHRIGQTKEVTVYRLAHRSTIEEMIIERQQIKMRWDTLIIGKEGKLGFMNSQNFDKLDLNDLFKNADDLIEDKPFTDEDIDTILRVSEEKFKELKKKLDQKFEDLQKKLDEQIQLGLKSMNMMEHFQSKEKDFVITSQLISKMRQKVNSKKPQPEIRKQNVRFEEIRLQYQHDYYNFYDNNKRIIELKQKQLDFEVFQEALDDGKNITDIDDLMIEDLSEKENQELSMLLESGFGWEQKDYQQFMSAFKECGFQPEQIQQNMRNNPSIKEIEKYLKFFTERCSEIPDGEVDLIIVQKNIKERVIQKEMTQFLGQLIKIIKQGKDDAPNESLTFIKNQFYSQEIKRNTNEKFIAKPKGLYQFATEDFDFTLLDTAFKHGCKWEEIGKDLKENKFQDDESFIEPECLKYLKYLTEIVVEKFKVLIRIDDKHLRIVVEKFGIGKESLQNLIKELDVKQEDIIVKKSRGKKVIKKQPQNEQLEKQDKVKPEKKEQNQKRNNSKKEGKSKSKSKSKNRNKSQQQEQKPKTAKAQPRNRSQKNEKDPEQAKQQQLKVVKKPLKARDESKSPDVVDKAVKNIGKKAKK
ncbi:hypothetical protein pb186bvf_010032 [Paramecium bursaria]